MTAVSSQPAGLVGRRAELGTVLDLVDRLRDRDTSRALVIRGEPGIGKTSLLRAASERAAAGGVRVLSTAGAQAEADLPFAGLHRLLLPLLARLERLPGRQRDALAGAFGLGAEAGPDRFLVAVAALNLLADEGPLLCTIDDAQWLDPPSAQALGFVARRLSAEEVVLLFAANAPADELSGLPELALEGLRDAEARELLGSVAPGRLDDRVRERILAEARGNPLALHELPRGLTPAQLAGGFGLPAVMSVPRRIEESFLRRIEALPADTRRLLLVAAAEPTGEAALLWRAAQELGIPNEALAPAEAAGLLEVGVGVRFRHPLVRSAVYRRASVSERRDAHLALAHATDPELDPDRRAWHRGEAASGPDEGVALELERSAARAQARAGPAAAAAFLERSVGLTVDPRLRTRRALDAARAKFEAAAPDPAARLLATAEMGPLDDLQRARAERLKAQIAFARSGTSDVPGLKLGPQAPGLLLDAARRLGPLDAELARETYLEAVTAAMCAGSGIHGCGVKAVAEAAREAPPGPQPPRPVDVLLDSLVARFTEPYEDALPPLRSALHALAGTSGEDNPLWLWFACPIAPEPLALDLWDDEKWHELATRAVTLCRDAGALAVLPQALTYRASMHVLAGEFDDASALLDEAYAIAEATGGVPLRYPSMLLAAWRGDEAAALKVIDEVTQDARERGLERSIGFAQCLTALLYNGLGRYREALVAALRARAYFPTDDLDDLGPLGWALIELIEAAVRSGGRDVAAGALSQLEERTQASRTEWALGIEARSRALLAEGAEAERLYLEAIERLARIRIRVELPRARLYYGEWLRRERRRVDAREQLRLAYDAFAAMGAQAFAERARRELMATGERLRTRSHETRDELTPRESQIARLARDGLTSPEIAAQLFLSARTVEYHLHKVFAKLDINSRMGLRDVLPEADQPGED
jgi:DNA-binding CsgD family transcriptional regulator